MVTRLLQAGTIGVVWLQEQAKQPLLKRLDPPTRAKVLAALAGLIILGFLMVFLTWLGARAARKYMRLGDKQGNLDHDRATKQGADDWTSKPLS